MRGMPIMGAIERRDAEWDARCRLPYEFETYALDSAGEVTVPFKGNSLSLVRISTGAVVQVRLRCKRLNVPGRWITLDAPAVLSHAFEEVTIKWAAQAGYVARFFFGHDLTG